MSLSDERLEEIASSLGKSTVYGEITSALRELQSLRSSQAKVVEALEKALQDVRQELWVDYCLRMGRTDTDPRPFNSKPHIRIIDDALSELATAEWNRRVQPECKHDYVAYDDKGLECKKCGHQA